MWKQMLCLLLLANHQYFTQLQEATCTVSQQRHHVLYWMFSGLLTMILKADIAHIIMIIHMQASQVRFLKWPDISYSSSTCANLLIVLSPSVFMHPVGLAVGVVFSEKMLWCYAYIHRSSCIISTIMELRWNLIHHKGYGESVIWGYCVDSNPMPWHLGPLHSRLECSCFHRSNFAMLVNKKEV